MAQNMNNNDLPPPPPYPTRTASNINPLSTLRRVGSATYSSAIDVLISRFQAEQAILQPLTPNRTPVRLESNKALVFTDLARQEDEQADAIRSGFGVGTK
jgi:hypothetical protein